MRKWLVPSIVFAAAATVSLAIHACGEDEGGVYQPGLGDIMLANQTRHAKLWFAGEAQNWPLASFELDEIEEGFEEVVKYHPTHENSPASLAQTLPALTDKPIAALHAAIEKQSVAEFTNAFDSLTKACNACHLTTNYSFNVITRPTGSWFLNQDFAPVE